MWVDIFAHIHYCQRGNTMGTQRAQCEDTPVELVAVPLLSVLGVLWDTGYDHAFAQIAIALGEKGFGYQWRPWIRISKRRGCNITIAITTTVAETSMTRRLNFQKFEDDLVITPEPTREFVHIPSSVLQLRVSIDPNKISEDERAQLGLTRAAR